LAKKTLAKAQNTHIVGPFLNILGHHAKEQPRVNSFFAYPA
jgi:hypothetical protein